MPRHFLPAAELWYQANTVVFQAPEILRPIQKNADACLRTISQKGYSNED